MDIDTYDRIVARKAWASPQLTNLADDLLAVLNSTGPIAEGSIPSATSGVPV